jgi:DNA-binding MarR family transcriptional regulator
MDPDSVPKPTGETLVFMQCMFQLVHSLDVRSKRMMQTLGVTGPQRLVIRHIGQRAGRTASELAAILGMHPSTLTGILARLETRGSIARERDEQDRRVSRFRLTALGKKIDRERRGTVEAAVRRALARAERGSVEQSVGIFQMLSHELQREDE